MSIEDTYQTIKSDSRGEFRDRGSKFISFAHYLSAEDDAKDMINQHKLEHPAANHHCFAYRLTPDLSVYRFSDDREPSGSAGRPILNAILSAGLTNILIVIVRYFGGTLLGVPGLINAYREAAADAIRNAETIEKIITEKFSIECPYELLNETYHFLRINKATILNHESAETTRIFFEIRKSQIALFEAAFNNHHPLNSRAILHKLIYE